MKFMNVILALFLAVKYTGKLLALFGGCRSFGIIIVRFWKQLEHIGSKRDFLSSLDRMSFYLICNTMDVMTSFAITLTWKRIRDLSSLITWLKEEEKKGEGKLTLVTVIDDLNLLLIVNICRKQNLNDSDLFAKQMGAFVTTNN